MKKWSFRLLLVAGFGALAIWIWRVLFPSPEQVIRKRLGELAQAASFSSKEAPLASLANSATLASFFTDDVEFILDVPGHSQQKVSGRDQLLQAAMSARSALGGLSVEFLDINVIVGPDKTSAVADLTAKGRVQGEPDLLVQELKLTLKKIQGHWLISRLETVKTLSQTAFWLQFDLITHRWTTRGEGRVAAGCQAGTPAPVKTFAERKAGADRWKPTAALRNKRPLLPHFRAVQLAPGGVLHLSFRALA